MNEDCITAIKIKINEFIWQNARPDMTLEEAEIAACDLLESMYPGSIPDYRKSRVCEWDSKNENGEES